MPADDKFPFPSGDNLEKPLEHGFAITPHASNELTYVTRAIMVTADGDVNATLVGGETIVIPGLLAGTLYPFRIKAVKVDSTTATGIVGFY